jgi:hypothetical protein
MSEVSDATAEMALPEISITIISRPAIVRRALDDSCCRLVDSAM